MNAGTTPNRVAEAVIKPTLSELGLDLTRVSPLRIAWSLAIPFFCLIGYAAFARVGWWIPAVGCLAAMAFFTYGSISHDLVHANLGLPPRVNDVFLSIIEAICLRSGHAYRLAHLRHHATFPSPEDVEADRASRGFLRALADGPLMIPRICAWAIHEPGKHRRWVIAECLVCACITAISLALLSITLAPLVYVAISVAGTWIFPIVTVWLPHDRQGSDALTRTRLFRGRVLGAVAVEHLYHLEHHLYPSVPHHHWPALAARLDPYFQRAGVIPIRLLF